MRSRSLPSQASRVGALIRKVIGHGACVLKQIRPALPPAFAIRAGFGVRRNSNSATPAIENGVLRRIGGVSAADQPRPSESRCCRSPRNAQSHRAPKPIAPFKQSAPPERAARPETKNAKNPLRLPAAVFAYLL